MKRETLLAWIAATTLVCAAHATDGIWQGTSASWADLNNWQDNDIAQGGGISTFINGNGITALITNDLPSLALGGMNFSGAGWDIHSAEPIAFATGADETNTINVASDLVKFYFQFAPGLGTIRKTGADGYININVDNQLFAGRWLVTSNRVEIKTGTSLRAEPASLVPDALTLDGGTIKNNDSNVVFPPTMGITLGEGGGAFVVGWNERYSIALNSPITGPGRLTIAQNNGHILLANSANDYAGGTLVGSDSPGWNLSGNNPPGNLAYLRLGADGVLPYGDGKGGLHIEGAYRGLVDLAGHSNRVSTLTVTSGGILTNNVPGTGMIVADGLSLAGRLREGTRVVWTGADTLDLNMADGNGAGTVAIAANATVTAPLALGGATLALDGVTLTLDLPFADSEAALTINNGILDIGPGGATLALASGSTATSISLTGGVISDGAPLTAGAPLTVGSAGALPAFFDADVSTTVTFRDNVWVRRTPADWDIAPGGASVVLSGDALDVIDAFTSAGATVRIAPDSDGFTGPLTLGSDQTLWCDTLTQTDGRILNTSGSAGTLDTDVALNGGTLGFTGIGTATAAGVISGNGTLIKAGTGTTILNGANTFIGSVIVSNGTLVVGSAAALGNSGNTVTMRTGGRIANAQNADITIDQAMTVTGGGFTVNGGSITLNGGLTLADGTLYKLGDGELIINAATLTSPAGLNLTGDAVVYYVAPGTTNELNSLRGSGDLILRGGGAVIVSTDPTYTGRLVLEDCILLNTFAPAPTPTLWLDASANTTLQFDGTGGIVRWNDARDGATGNAHPHAWLNDQAPNVDWPGYQEAVPPTLIPNELAGNPVVDFGVYRSGSWMEIGPIANARTLFWVLGSQNGGGHLIGAFTHGSARGSSSVDNNIAASDSLWNSSSWNGEPFRNSANWINGTAVNGRTTGLSGGYDLITTELPSTPAAILHTLAKEGRTTISNISHFGRSGGQRLAELIVYDRALSEDERKTTETYLSNKWGIRIDNTSSSTAYPEVSVTGPGTVQASAGFTSFIPKLSGNGTLTKTGDGTMNAEQPEAFIGTLRLAEGTFTADGPVAQITKNASPTDNPVPGAAFWVDASAPNTFGTDAAGRVYWRDARWNDGTGTDYIVATQRWTFAPFMRPNAVGDLPVIDMGPADNAPLDKGMQWSRTLNNARTIFWLIGSQDGGGILLGSLDDGSSAFNRYRDFAPASAPIYSTYTSGNIVNGITRIDHVQVDGMTTGLNGDYQVIAVRTTGNITVGQFAHDREMAATTNRHGGQRLGEVLVYTNALTDAEMRAVEGYLMLKWQRPLIRGTTAAITHVDVPAEGEPPVTGTLDVASRHLNVSRLTGSGLLRKTGDATLALNTVGAYSGEFTVEGGRVAVSNGGVPRTPAFWVDASRTDTIEYDQQTMEISRWNDCRNNEKCAEFKIISNEAPGEFPPSLLPNDLNGMSVVDFGKWTSNQHLSWNEPLEHIRTVFWVFGSQAGGGLLLSWDRSNGIRDFYRAGSGVNEADLLGITNSNPIWSTRYPCDVVNGGQTRLNGVIVNGETTGLSGGYDIISLRTTGDARASSFGNDRQRFYRDSTGGQRLAEVIVYEEPLTDDEIRQVESYLHAKWGVATAPGADVSGDPLESQMCLTLRNGATLELGGTKAHTIGAIGGIGSVTDGALTVSGLRQIGAEQAGDALTLAGSLTLAANADWTAEPGPIGIAPILAEDAITFAGGGTLTITNAKALPDGDTLLLQGASLTGFTPAAWTLVTDDTSRQYTLRAAGNTMYLTSTAKGLLLLLK